MLIRDGASYRNLLSRGLAPHCIQFSIEVGSDMMHLSYSQVENIVYAPSRYIS